MTSQRHAAMAPVLIALLAAGFHAAAAKKDPAEPDDTRLTHATESRHEGPTAGLADRAADLSVGATENVAVANRLSSVRVVWQNTSDDEEEFVRFCFGNAVQSLDEGKASSFAVVGPDPAVGERAIDVTLDDAHENCVIAGFSAGTDVRSYTLAEIEGGVVKNRDDEKNIADSAPLRGGRSVSTRDRTAGPDLTGVRISKALNRIAYHFDGELDEHARADAGSFGFYTARGDARTGSKIVSVDNRVVRVEFGDDDQVDNARRGFVKAGAVRDGGGSENPVGSLGSRTSNPDLIGARKAAAETQYHYTFDDNVWPRVAPANFVLYTDNGTEIEGESAEVDGHEVHVTFPREIEDYDSGDIVLAAVNPQADTPNETDGDGSGEPITSGAKAIGSQTTRRGRTTGPDLVSVSTDVAGRLMTLRFDERVDDDNDTIDASRIYIATDDDALVKANRIVEIEGETVYVKADENDLESLMGVTLEPDAIKDPAGNGNPLDTLAHDRAITGAR